MGKIKEWLFNKFCYYGMGNWSNGALKSLGLVLGISCAFGLFYLLKWAIALI